jgi:hypothetical protein
MNPQSLILSRKVFEMREWCQLMSEGKGKESDNNQKTEALRRVNRTRLVSVCGLQRLDAATNAIGSRLNPWRSSVNNMPMMVSPTPTESSWSNGAKRHIGYDRLINSKKSVK